MIYRPWVLPDIWRTILHTLEKKPKTFDDLLNIGIDRDKLKEILTAMVKLNMIENTGGLKYSLKKKRGGCMKGIKATEAQVRAIRNLMLNQDQIDMVLNRMQSLGIQWLKDLTIGEAKQLISGLIENMQRLKQ